MENFHGLFALRAAILGLWSSAAGVAPCWHLQKHTTTISCSCSRAQRPGFGNRSLTNSEVGNHGLICPCENVMTTHAPLTCSKTREVYYAPPDFVTSELAVSARNKGPDDI